MKGEYIVKVLLGQVAPVLALTIGAFFITEKLSGADPESYTPVLAAVAAFCLAAAYFFVAKKSLF